MKSIGKKVDEMRKKLPEIIVIILCLALLGIGVSHKEGYHMDELLSFQLSNAEYNPWIVPTQPEGRLAKFIHNEIEGENLKESIRNLKETVLDVLQNRRNSKILSYQADVYDEPIWISSEEFVDYVSVDREDDFNYLSVYFNVKDDNHPPVHFMLLHTMSSLFQETIRPFVGCIINMFAFAVTLVFLMKLGVILAEILGINARGRILGIFVALIYGVSTGALASVLLIRMYCTLTMFCVMLLYIHLKKWNESCKKAEKPGEGGGFTSKNRWLIIVTVSGFLTQYFFLFYCIVLAVVTVVFLTYCKKWKDLCIYIRSMVVAAGIGLLCFPFAISDVFASERGVEALEKFSSGLSGFGMRIVVFWDILKERTLGDGLFVLTVVAIVGSVFICVKKGQLGRNSVCLPFGALGMLFLPVITYFLLAAKMSPYLVDRYIMLLFPMVMLIIGTGMICIIECIKIGNGKKYIVYLLCGIVTAMSVRGLFQYDGSYLYAGYEKQLEVAKEYAEYPCICVYDGVGYYENLMEFTYYEKTLLLTEAELIERIDVASVSGHDKLMVLLKEEINQKEVVRMLEEKYGLMIEKYIPCDSVYGDQLVVFATSMH